MLADFVLLRTRKKTVPSFLLITSCFLIFSHVGFVFGDETTYEFGEDCLFITKDVDYDEEMYVEYNGKTVDLSCDYFRFGGPGYGFFNEYSVCVTPLYFNDSECAVKLNIKTSLFESTKHKITCTENKIAPYCGPKNENLYIEFEKRYGRDTNGAKFKLKITTRKEYVAKESTSSKYVIGAIIGGVIGGLVLITVCIAIYCWCVCRRKPSQGRVLNPTLGYPATSNPYAVQAAQTQQSMMATPSSVLSPVVYPIGSQPSPQGTASPQTIENKLASVPPSYDAFTESSTSHIHETNSESSKTLTNEDTERK
ncbi:uncharacterized protein LOC128158657 isoform X1 [Crassostrea angulata]|uniref:uncharacterized protein LOC128158657 isoform X1 n=1 Tax=Magallana angulata TaxID=2784310 RepID=UPI0022B0F280|nr:uncharacterized protein LOC128158657 isoform X1 [Crassostrea angulata]